MIAQNLKNPPAMQETLVRFLGQEDSPGKGRGYPTAVFLGFPGGSYCKESPCNAGDLDSPWVGKISWRRTWQPTPGFLPGDSPWTEESGGLQSMGLQRVGHD